MLRWLGLLAPAILYHTFILEFTLDQAHNHSWARGGKILFPLNSVIIIFTSASIIHLLLLPHRPPQKKDSKSLNCLNRQNCCQFLLDIKQKTKQSWGWKGTWMFNSVRSSHPLSCKIQCFSISTWGIYFVAFAQSTIKHQTGSNLLSGNRCANECACVVFVGWKKKSGLQQAILGRETWTLDFGKWCIWQCSMNKCCCVFILMCLQPNTTGNTCKVRHIIISMIIHAHKWH